MVKLRHEPDVTEELLTEQIRFSQHLADCGIPTARFHPAAGAYVIRRVLSGYAVLVTVEDFRQGELRRVTPALAEQTGALLGRTHAIARRDHCHVRGPVLFDPFGQNELFSYEDFLALEDRLAGEELRRFRRIQAAYRQHMDALAPLRRRERYAVQGDISNCNLFLTENGEIGLFDFNRCGDAVLFCDAVMQGVFESRLMDYDRALTEDYAGELFARFLAGYHRANPLSPEERDMLPHLYAVITALWRGDLTDGAGRPLLERAERRITQNLRVNL